MRASEAASRDETALAAVSTAEMLAEALHPVGSRPQLDSAAHLDQIALSLCPGEAEAGGSSARHPALVQEQCSDHRGRANLVLVKVELLYFEGCASHEAIRRAD